MAKERKYEFQYLSKEARIKIIASKAVVFALTTGCLLALMIENNYSLESRLHLAACVFSGFFAYLNLMDVEVDVMEVFEWGFNHRGIEFVLVALALLLASAYLMVAT